LGYFVAVAEEMNFRRAATRLHMAQPPLSRAIKQLEMDLGCELLIRTSSGIRLTPAGSVLYDDARTLLAQADQTRSRLRAAAGVDAITIGTLASSAKRVVSGMVAAIRDMHPGLSVSIREAPLTDPTAGLRAGIVDVALTRLPFDNTGIETRVLRSDPVGAVLRSDDPLAGRHELSLKDLDDRRWFQFPDGTDPLWKAFWTSPGGVQREGPVVRTVQECRQAVLWNGIVGLTLYGDELLDGTTSVPLADMPPSELVVAWSTAHATPIVRSFVRIAVEAASG
jgi:DNA-binding transcriptional LysR family regulator